MVSGDNVFDKIEKKFPTIKMADEEEVFWSIEETANYLGYTPRWLRELAKKGMFYPVKVGKRWLFKKSKIDQFIADNN